MPLYSSINSPPSAKMATSVPSNDSVDTIVFSPACLSPAPRALKTIHLNTHIHAIDPRTTAVCPSPGPSRRSIIQSDGQDDSPPASQASSPSPGSQGHPAPITTSLPTTPTPRPWTPTTAPPPKPKLQRANSNPTSFTTTTPTPAFPFFFPPPQQPPRRRLSASPSPPSKLQTVPIEPLRRQGSGVDLSPIDECRISECDGKRKARLAREAEEARELARLQAQFLSDGSDDEVDDRRARDRDEHPTAAPLTEGTGTEEVDLKLAGGHKNKKAKASRPKNKKLARSSPSYGRVLDDPFAAAVVLLVLPFCPPLSVYLTFRECGGLNRHRVRELGVAAVLTVLGWLPGIVCEFLPPVDP